MGQQTAPFTSSISGNVIIDEANDRILILDDNQIPIALLGKDLVGDILVRVATPGVNVLTATEGELTFDSSRSFIVVANSTHIIPSISVASGTNSQIQFITIPHNLGYVPSFQAYFTDPNALFIYFQGVKTPITGASIQQGLYVTYQLFANIDATNLYLFIQYSNSDSSPHTATALDISYLIYTTSVA